jgi:hypothetical protein
MAHDADSLLDRLWEEYGAVFVDFDDLTLARWMSQTLAQLKGRSWRMSHPLLGTYRLASKVGHDRQIWLKRLVATPGDYVESACCRAPQLPVITRDLLQSGLICQHCAETLVPFEELPLAIQERIRPWAEEYAGVHAVAHWDEDQQRRAGDYDRAYDDAAKRAEDLLMQLGAEIVPLFLDHYTAVVWEDQDECLEVRPEDLLV